MTSRSVTAFFAKTLETVSASDQEAERRRTTLIETARKILRYPLKVAVLYVASPFLLFLVVKSRRKDGLRRIVAGTGIIVAVAAAWGAFKFLTSTAGAVLMGKIFGVFAFASFFIETDPSFWITLLLSLWTLLVVTWVFLHISSEDVVKALRSAAQDAE